MRLTRLKYFAAAFCLLLAHPATALSLSPVITNQFDDVKRTNTQIITQASQIKSNPVIAQRLLAQAEKRAAANLQAVLVRTLSTSPQDGVAISAYAKQEFPQYRDMIQATTRRTLPALSKHFGSPTERRSKQKVPYYVPKAAFAQTSVTTAAPYPTYRSNLDGINQYSAAAHRTARSYKATIEVTGSPTLPDRTKSDDPLQGLNRAMLTVNDTLDTLILRPIAVGYDFILPEPVQSGVYNVFQNLSEPSVILNNVLQGDIAGAGRSGARFVVNTTFGLLGLFDVAEMNGDMPFRAADFGQTLHTYGVGEGAYLVLPILGPHTSRDAFGSIVDIATNPLFYAGLDTGANAAVTGVNIVSQREAIMPAYDNMKENSLDWYTTLRSSYLQNRRSFLEDVTSDPFEGGTYQISGNDPFDSFD